MQVPSYEHDRSEHGPEDGEFEWSVVADRLGSEDQTGYERHGERDAPVEAACLRVRPGVHGAHDFAPLVGVRALSLGRTIVADLGPAPVAHQPPLVIHFAPDEELVLGADPGVMRGMVGEPGGAVALGAGVRVAGQEVEPESDTDQEDRVSHREEDLELDIHHATAPAPRWLRAR